MILETISYLTNQIPLPVIISIGLILLIIMFAVVIGAIYNICHEQTRSYPAFLLAYWGCLVCSCILAVIIWCIQELGTTLLPYPLTFTDIPIFGLLACLLLYGSTLIYNKTRWGQCFPWYYHKTEKRK